ncbi:thiamine phosphate synthase [soil metagenome]
MRALQGVGRPIVYVITNGQATVEQFDEAAGQIILLIEAAVAEKVALIQIREKRLLGKQLFELASMSVRATRGTSTKLLINDRTDIAAAAGADGVHLTETSIPVSVVRKAFGDKLIIGQSVHSAKKAIAASEDGADFAVYSPVFGTPGKGTAVGIESLAETCSSVAPFPMIGLGGIDVSNCKAVVQAGAAGVAGIRSFSERKGLRSIIRALDDD